MPTTPPPDKSPKKVSTPSSRKPFFVELKQLLAAGPQDIEKALQPLRTERIQQLQQLRQSQLIVYYSLEPLGREDAENFYEVLSTLEDVTNLDLFLFSPGGFSDPAFKMARLCQDVTRKGRFSVLIPLYAKSAATILALGADELIMGPPSELGPIDPQIRLNSKKLPVPLHALWDALQYIEQRVTINPNLASLYESLMSTIDLMSLGHYDREIQGAQQYAEYLLCQRMFKDDPAKARQISLRFTAGYKRHSYVIDRDEARHTLQLNVKDASPAEWKVIWQLHNLYHHLVRDSIRQKLPAKAIETADILFRP